MVAVSQFPNMSQATHSTLERIEQYAKKQEDIQITLVMSGMDSNTLSNQSSLQGNRLAVL